MTYYLIRSRTFYGETHARRDVVLTRHGAPGPMTFTTREEASRYADMLDAGRYYQANNEYGRATYTVVTHDKLPKWAREYLG